MRKAGGDRSAKPVEVSGWVRNHCVTAEARGQLIGARNLVKVRELVPREVAHVEQGILVTKLPQLGRAVRRG